MQLTSVFLAPLLLPFALLASASPYARLHRAALSNTTLTSPRRPAPRHADDDCDLTQTYTTTYTSDSAHTYTILSVSTAVQTYTSLLTSTRAIPGPKTVTATKTRTATQTVTDYTPTATVTVTATHIQTQTQTAETSTHTLVSTYTNTATNTAATSAPSSVPGGECNTGSMQCCDKVAPANSTQMSSIISALGIALDLADTLVGTSCSPIDVLSLGAAECNQSPVCCNNNDYQGLVNIGCVPITL